MHLFTIHIQAGYHSCDECHHMPSNYGSVKVGMGNVRLIMGFM